MSRRAQLACVVVRRVDRLGRSLIDVLSMVNLLRERGGSEERARRLAFYLEGDDFTTFTDDFVELAASVLMAAPRSDTKRRQSTATERRDSYTRR